MHPVRRAVSCGFYARYGEESIERVGGRRSDHINL